MIGDDHVHGLSVGVGDGFVGADAGVARQDQPGASGDDSLEHRDVDAVRFVGTHRDVVGDVSAQVAQGGDQYGGGGLAVHVEIAPHADRLALADGPFQAVDGLGHAWQFGGRGGGVIIRVEESACRGDIGEAAPGQCGRD